MLKTAEPRPSSRRYYEVVRTAPHASVLTNCTKRACVVRVFGETTCSTTAIVDLCASSSANRLAAFRRDVSEAVWPLGGMNPKI